MEEQFNSDPIFSTTESRASDELGSPLLYLQEVGTNDGIRDWLGTVPMLDFSPVYGPILPSYKWKEVAMRVERGTNIILLLLFLKNESVNVRR